MSCINRRGSTSQPWVTPSSETSSSTRSVRTRSTSGTTSTDSFDPRHPNEQPQKSLLPKLADGLLTQVKTIQNSKKIKLFVKGHKNAVHPEQVPGNAFYKAGISPSLSRSRTLVQLMKENENLFGHSGAPHGDRILDPEQVIKHLNNVLPAQSNVSPREKKGIKLYLTAMSQNLRDLVQSIEALPESMRPAFCYYAGMTASIADSKIMIKDLQAFGVLDNKMLPKDGDKAFDHFTEIYPTLREYKTNTNSRTQIEDLDRVMNGLNNLREILFPLPTYKH